MPKTRHDDLPAAPQPQPKRDDPPETTVGSQSADAHQGRREAAEKVEDVDDNMATIDA